ncbi:MAG: SUMF1/EgtB/PvdO family nonheme iron enzyme [Planctomycetes bacterium]|nr:SUMF1/EgtB/PvdO family nonheme iron enzyme [Planctomycetota bacterium]
MSRLSLFLFALIFCLSASASCEKAFENSLGMVFRLMPGGDFTVGPPGLEAESLPWATGNPAAGETVKISRPYLLCIHEVRVRDYRAFCEARNHPGPVGEHYQPAEQKWRPGFEPLEDKVWGQPDLPVTCVTFDDALAFCEWLSKKEGRVYRLPTEVEWEYAARAGSDRAYQAFERLEPTKINGNLGADYPVKANPGDEMADAEAGLGDADKVGEAEAEAMAGVGGGAASPEDRPFPPNAWGLYHMLGNVQEFVMMTRQPPEGDIPLPGWTLLPGKVNRMLRGGSWLHPERDCTVYQANFNCPPYTNCTMGFRVLLEVDAGE